MSDETPSAPSSMNRRLLHGRHSTLVRIVAFLILTAVVVYVGVAAQNTMQQKEYVRLTEARTVSSAGLSSLGHKGARQQVHRFTRPHAGRPTGLCRSVPQSRGNCRRPHRRGR